MRIKALSLTLFLLTSCEREPPVRTPEAGRPASVVVIVLDSLRADHVGCYGYDRSTTPRIDAFAEGATRYTHALASAPWTLPSHASMLTGLHPFEHGAHTFAVESPVVDNVGSLDDAHFTLAEYLGGHGYATGAFLANEAFLAERYNLDQGFGVYEVEHIYAEELNTRILRWVDQHNEQPIFLLVNYMDVHQPFNLRRRPGFLEHVANKKRNASRKLVRSIRDELLPGTGPVPQEKLRQLEDMYDLALANMDEQVGVLLDELERRGVLREAVVVITSDHGENFGEHHLLGHSKDVYRQTMDVPLVIRVPGQSEGLLDASQVTSADLPHLVLGGFPQPLPGENPFPVIDRSEGSLGENYYTRVKDLFGTPWAHRFDRVRRTLVLWPWKLIHSSDGNHELYQLDLDPDELVNRYEADVEVAARMLGKLEATIADGTTAPVKAPVVPLSSRELEQMRALGYVDDE
jgi:arylsulfatase A-like enzyme